MRWWQATRNASSPARFSEMPGFSNTGANTAKSAPRAAASATSEGEWQDTLITAEPLGFDRPQISRTVSMGTSSERK